MKIKGIRNIKGNYRLIKKREENIEKIVDVEAGQESEKEEVEIGRFQLVVIEQIPWYKKAVKTIGKLLKNFFLKEITIKV